MHPLLKRILINGGVTAALLAGAGVLLAQFAGMYSVGQSGKPGTTDTSAAITDEFRVRVPLMMAFWGVAIVVVGELIRWRFRGAQPAIEKKVEEPQPDAEKLLNELLMQAEAKRALESQESAGQEQKTA